MPLLQENRSIIKYIDNTPAFQRKEIKFDSNILISMYGTHDQKDEMEVQKLIRHQADTGQGFAVDEFNQDGHYNRNMFWKSDTICVRDTADNIVAAAIYGPSIIARSASTNLTHVHIASTNYSQSPQVAGKLLSECVQHTKNLGYKGCFTDVFVNDRWTFDLFVRAGFIIMGTIPYIGITRQNGPTHGMLMYLKY